MAIIHMVVFKINPLLDEEMMQEVCKRMIALKTECIHPSTKQPYIVNASVGKDNSHEGKQGGFTHGFVAEFASIEDRDYYITKDKAHLDYIEWAIGEQLLADVQVVDYEVGVF